MIAWGTVTLMLPAAIAAGGGVGGGVGGAVGERFEIAQLLFRERVVVRVPARKAPPTIKWKEKRAPKCMSAEGLAGAAVIEPDSIDLIARGGKRFRVELAAACPGLEFYSGFYLVPSADRMICAGRDEIHARSGGACQIKRFRKLVPDD